MKMIRRCVLIKKVFLSSAYTRSLRLPVLTSFALIVVLLSAVTCAAQDQPTIAKDSVQVTAFTLSSYKKDFKVFSWVPKLNLRVNGPIASGSQIYAEFTAPRTCPWKFYSQTNETGTVHLSQVANF